MGMHWATGLSTRTASDPIGEIGDSRLTLTKNDEEPAPHLPQNVKPGGFSKSQCAQRGLSLVPQRPQKFMPAGFSKPQLGQRMGVPSGTAVRVVGASRHLP
jgi:hypothetical protein